MVEGLTAVQLIGDDIGGTRALTLDVERRPSLRYLRPQHQLAS